MITRILAIIPAYNEAGSIGRTVREILAVQAGLVPLVIDDGSGDDTRGEALRAGAIVISLPFNLGIGGAVQTGYRYALEHDFDIAVQIDGDGQHDPAYLDVLLRPVMGGDADMSIGSRFLGGKEGFRSSFTRRIGIGFFRGLIRCLTGFEPTDPTSGFRACNKRLIALFAGYYPSDFPEPEAVVVTRRIGARILDVPVVMRPREAGKSSIGKLKSPYYMIKVTGAILLHMLKDRKVYGPWA